jgi:hypothetical protein
MMESLDEIRARAREHTRQLAAVHFATVQILAARWNVDEETVRDVPRDRLPYLEFGKTHRRRYDPLDIEAYERAAKAPLAQP